jgi:hypothetical protein
MPPKALVITPSIAATTLREERDTSMQDTDLQLVTVGQCHGTPPQGPP